MTVSITKPTVGGSEGTWGTTNNQALDDIVAVLNGTTASTPNLTAGSWKVGGTAVTASAAEINMLSGQTSLVPSGVIVMWSGQTSAIPAGWVLCDGSNSTPDLRDKFIMGAGASNELSTGGTNSLTIASANLPSHTHSFSATTSSAGAHTHSVNDPGHSHGITVGSNADLDNDVPTTSGSGSTDSTLSATTGISIASAGDHTHTVSGTTGATGSGTAIDNRPSYMALAYIMKT